MWAAALVMGVANVGCAAETSGQPEQAVTAPVISDTSSPTIFGGNKDDDSKSLAGVVALRVGTGSTFELCSGALIAPNVVLTARHCVTKNVTTSVSCDENGHSANGPHVSEDEDPASIGVYTGVSPSFAKPPVATARAILAPSGRYLCDSDIALVVLKTPIDDVAPLPVRLTSAAFDAETIRAVGYGQNDKSSPIGTRFRKVGVPILAQGKGVSPSKTPLGAHEFEVGKSICQGDSGGPAISEETGAVIGVVSRGGGCDDDFGHIYTTTAGFDDLFAQTMKLAGAKATIESGVPTTSGPRARGTTTKEAADEDAREGMGGCAIGAGARKGGAGGAGTAGLVVISAAVAAAFARRRRSI